VPTLLALAGGGQLVCGFTQQHGQQLSSVLGFACAARKNPTRTPRTRESPGLCQVEPS
jgi:hypothetical protein